jgi:regulator of RNase E activity RraA
MDWVSARIEASLYDSPPAGTADVAALRARRNRDHARMWAAHAAASTARLFCAISARREPGDKQMAAKLSHEAREKLKNVSTATLTTVLFKRGLRNTYIQGIRPLNPSTPPMVGEAYTLRYIPSREDLDTLDVFKDRSHPQRKAVEDIPPGHVLVMDCRGDATVASAGSILVTRMMMRGAAGVVSDGGLRDSPEIARLAIPTYCAGPSAPTNLIKHHAVDLNVPIGCGGVPVFPGDIMVGDGEGVVVIPAHLAEEVASEAFEQDRFETFVTEKVKAGAGIFGLYPPNEDTQKEYAAWKAKRG